MVIQQPIHQLKAISSVTIVDLNVNQGKRVTCMPSTNRAKNTKDGHVIYAIAILDNEFAATILLITFEKINSSNGNQ